MRPINYPSNITFLESNYKSRLVNSRDLNLKKIDYFLNKISYNSKKLCFEDLLVYSLQDLLKIEKLVNSMLSKVQKSLLNRLFNYKKHQGKIADFFMNISGIDLNSCYYCNIDYINPFLDLADYNNPLEFINNANHIELQYLIGVGSETAKKIINKKPRGGYKSIYNIPSLKVISRSQLKFLHFNKTHNHFTLDHVIPQSKGKFLSLCFYNFVPSCYSCNSKFKNDKEFSKTSSLIQTSPSSPSFSMHKDLTFKIYFDSNLENIKSQNDFILQLESIKNTADEYKSMFKLEGRYIYHKKIIPKMIRKKVDYTESKIRDISKITGLDQIEIKKTIFGEELFEKKLTNEPLVKFKRDIARQIKIKGIVKD